MRPYELRQRWPEILSGAISPEQWRNNQLDREVIETILLDSVGAAAEGDLPPLVGFLRSSGLLDVRLHEARSREGWQQRSALEKGQKCRISFVPDPACWTQVPAELGSLSAQRSRRHRGLFQVPWGNRDMLFKPKYGRVGFILLPYLWVFELIEPLIEILGYTSILASLVLRTANWAILLALLILGYGFAILISIGSIVLEEMTYRRYQRWHEVVRLILPCFLEQFPYRLLHAVWRTQELFQHVSGTRRLATDKAFRVPSREGNWCLAMPLS